MRRLVTLVLLIAATAALAQSHGRAIMPLRPDVSGETVSGTVSAVNGSIVSLAGGLVTLDVSNAKSSGDIVAGALLYAQLKPGPYTANAPLPAAFVGITPLPQVTLSGAVSAVDLTTSTLTLLGRAIKTDAQTNFTGLMTFRAMTLADVMPGQFVVVEANASGNALLAKDVHVVTLQIPSVPTVIHGTVKSIGTDSWVVTVNGKDVTVAVNASTKIVNDPKVGDTVDVIVGGDHIAVAIMKEGNLPGLRQMHLTGFVKSIGTTEWTIGGPAGSLMPDFRILLNANTKIVGDPKVGDRVEVVGDAAPNGIVASTITKIP